MVIIKYFYVLSLVMRKVMVFGTFDILHPGHLNFFSQARNYGDYLVAAVARDKTVRQVKGHPKNCERIRLLEVSDHVDKAVLGYEGDKYRIIEEVKPDIICIGYDQKFFVDSLRQEILKRGMEIKIIKLEPYKPDIYKSSKLRH